MSIKQGATALNLHRPAGTTGPVSAVGHAVTGSTFSTSSPKWLTTFTAILPDFGGSNGTLVVADCLAHADAVVAELRTVVADLFTLVEAQQASTHRLVKMTFGHGGERVEGPTLFDGIEPPEVELPPPVEPPPAEQSPPRKRKGHADAASRRTCRVARK